MFDSISQEFIPGHDEGHRGDPVHHEVLLLLPPLEAVELGVEVEDSQNSFAERDLGEDDGVRREGFALGVDDEVSDEVLAEGHRLVGLVQEVALVLQPGFLLPRVLDEDVLVELRNAAEVGVDREEDRHALEDGNEFVAAKLDVGVGEAAVEHHVVENEEAAVVLVARLKSLTIEEHDEGQRRSAIVALQPQQPHLRQEAFEEVEVGVLGKKPDGLVETFEVLEEVSDIDCHHVAELCASQLRGEVEPEQGLDIEWS